MADETYTLIDRVREALSLQQEHFVQFVATLTPEDLNQLRQWVDLVDEMLDRHLVHGKNWRLPNYTDPVNELDVAFTNLIFRAQTRLTTYGTEEIFGRWTDILTQNLRSRKNAVMRRWVLRPRTMSKRAFCKLIATENAAFPPNEQEGWSSVDQDRIKALLNQELSRLREQPNLQVIEGGRKDP
jgi:hypothetical protein